MFQFDRRGRPASQPRDTIKHLGEPVDPGDFFIGFRIEAVKADIDPPEPCFLKPEGKICKESTIGGERGLHSIRH